MHIVLYNLHLNKPNPVYQEIACALRRLGHTVWLASLDGAGNLEWHNGERLVGLHPEPAHLPGWLQRVWLVAPILKRILWFNFTLRVRRFLRRAKPDIIQVNTYRYPWILPLLMPDDMCFIFDIRQINENVGNGFIGRLRNKKMILTMKACSRLFYDHACFCHEQAARRIIGDIWAKKGSVVPVGIDPRFLSLNSLTSGPKSRENQVRFIYLGTLSRLRNLEKILFAVQHLLPESNKFRVDFVGSDNAHGFYHKLVDKLQIGSVVTIRPPVPYDDVPRLLVNYDVGLAYVPDRPTWHYQPTLKVLEYRALGMPIISTNVAPHRKVVDHQVNGLLVQDSVEDMAAAMLRFITDQRFLQNCKANARVMRRGITWDVVATMYEQNVYQKLRKNDASDGRDSMKVT